MAKGPMADSRPSTSAVRKKCDFIGFLGIVAAQICAGTKKPAERVLCGF
jgi:hypothetical protein